MGTLTDLQSRPMYGFATVDAVLHLASGTAARWINGNDRLGRHYEPVIRPETTNSQTATWGEVVECRLLSEYRHAGVPIINLRPVVNRLRRELDTSYPLAGAHLWLSPEGRELIARAQVGIGQSLWLVRTGEDLLPIDWTPEASRLVSSVHWSDDRALAPEWFTAPGSDEIVIDPDRGFGQPVVRGRGVTAQVLAELVRAGDSVESVADWYDLELAQVQAAVAYDKRPA